MLCPKFQSLFLIYMITLNIFVTPFPSQSNDNTTKNITDYLKTDASWFLEQPEFQDFLETTSTSTTTAKPDADPRTRDGRLLQVPEPVGGPECSGRFMTLSSGDSTNIKSHNSFGLTPYPANYLCRWLILPNNCELNLVCSMGTRNQEGRNADLNLALGIPDQTHKCSNYDFLRVMGYKGAMDTVYCGNEKLSIKVGPHKTLAMIFQSQPRFESQFGEEMRQGLFDLLGFNCNVMCQSSEPVVESLLSDDNSTTTTTATTESTTEAATTTTTTTSTNSLLNGINQVQLLESAKLEENLKSSLNQNLGNLGRCICGESRQARIVCPPGDNCTAGIGTLPWQAGLVFRGSWQPWCGASLISDSYLLTAAHCVHNKPTQKIEIILSDHDWTTRTDATNEMRRQISRIVKHPYFGARANFDFDYAIIKIREPVTFADYPLLRPVCLPDSEKSDAALEGLAGTASGWGVIDPEQPSKQANELQRVLVKVMSTAECDILYQDTSKITDTMMCASGASGKNPFALGNLADACYGDSGGPFTVRQQGREVLEGVISWGRSCGQPQWPGVYAKVGRVLNWIRQETQDSQFCESDLD